MAENYSVRINKDYLVFSAGHFITFAGDICERIHGHNYRVEVEVFGPLDENHYVIDFILLRDQLKEIVDTLDHRMLLPTQHPQILVNTVEEEVIATFAERRWVFPASEVVLLPVPNTTTEMLAKYIGHQLLEFFSKSGLGEFSRLVVAVDENYGQWGIWDYRP